MAIETINPATGQKLTSYPETSAGEIQRSLHAAHHAFLEWRRSDFSERAGKMRAAAKLLHQSRDAYAKLMAQEMGKPVSQGQAEVDKCAWACEYFAESAQKFLAREPIATDATKSFVSFDPLGVILAIMPWNFPFWQVFRCAAPALMAGNSIMLKHASNVPGCALAIEQILREAGFPIGLFRSLLVESEHASPLIDNPAVKAVTLTGSVAADKAIDSGN